MHPIWSMLSAMFCFVAGGARRMGPVVLAGALTLALSGCYSMVRSGDHLVGEVGGYVSDKELVRIMMPMSLEQRTVILQAMKEGEPVHIGCSRGPGNYADAIALAPWNMKLKPHELVSWVRGDQARGRLNQVTGRLDSTLLKTGELRHVNEKGRLGRNYHFVSGVYKIACFPPDAR